ncbi:MAG TPA: PQQ-binding-like beta-propeller repeat protein [Chthoniobacteraceae bacterium]
MNSLFCPLAALLAFGWTFAANAQDWTRFRGPNGSGIGKVKLPAEISPENIRWKTALPGRGHSSPVIWGDRVFVTCTAAGTTQRLVVCVNAADGSILWQKGSETERFRLHADSDYCVSTPAVDAEHAFVLWQAPAGSSIQALRQADGKELWRVELGPFLSQHGPGVSPIVIGDLVIVYFDQDQGPSYVAAFDTKTGAERWRTPQTGGMASASTPCVVEQKGRTELILTSRTAGITALDSATGKQTWQLPGIMAKRCVASPVLAPNGLLYAQCGEGRAESFVYAVRPGTSAEPAAKLHEIVRIGGYVPTPIIVEDLLFLWKENGLVSCLRASTHEQLWSERLEGPFYGSPAYSDGRLFNMSVRGDLVIIRAADKFQPLARLPLGEGSHATPAFSRNRMFLRTFTHLLSVGE